MGNGRSVVEVVGTRDGMKLGGTEWGTERRVWMKVLKLEQSPTERVKRIPVTISNRR